MTLKELQIGKSAVIRRVGGTGALRQHFLDMGIIPGAEVTMVKLAPMGDPMELQIHGYELTLRLAEAEQIEIEEILHRSQAHKRILSVKDSEHPGLGEDGKYHSKEDETPLPESTKLTFALVGNQNCGKTTLFNQLTGSNQHVGNFPGVTVDRKSGTIKGYPNTEVTDLPGIYSMSPYSSEEVVSRNFVLEEKPRAIINIVDATNIERNLYLTMQLLEMDIPMLVALNMMDEVVGNHGAIDVNGMEALLGVPVVPISAAKNEGVDELVQHAIHIAKYQEHPLKQDFCDRSDHGGSVHRCIHAVIHLIEEHAKEAALPVRFAATKAIEGDPLILKQLALDANETDMLEHVVQQMETERGVDRSAAIADMRFDFIERLCDKTVVRPGESREHKRSVAMDKVLTGKYTADGETVTTSNGGRYTLWKMEGDANHWQNHFGSYKVPDGQYATRFFFASASGKTTGNLIDNVTFNQEQRYIIEYYLKDEKTGEFNPVPGLTETKTAEVNTTVSPQNLGSDKLKNAILTDSTINGKSYGGETMTILPRPDVDTTHRDCRNVLRLYFVTGAITVRKVVTIENWDDLTDAERKELGYDKPYTAKFELYEGAPVDGQKVAEASISFEQIDQSPKTGVAQFMQLNPDGSKEPYKPQANTAYWVKEVNVSTQTPLYAYGLTTTYEQSADGSSYGSFTTDEQANGSVTVTNAYALHLFDLTIKTSGVEAIDENQTYIYRVHGDDAHTKLIDLTVAIHGDGQATVKNLPSGKYKVTQVNTWSWRYTPEQTAEQIVTLKANGTVVEYTQNRAHEGDKGNKWKWLNGQHWIDNRWKDGSFSSGVPGDEGGDENSIKD